MDAIGVSPEKVVANARWEKIGAGEVWKGHWPLQRGERFPPTGQYVVHVLFDADTHPIYVRGTNRCAHQFVGRQVSRKRYLSWMVVEVWYSPEHGYFLDARNKAGDIIDLNDYTSSLSDAVKFADWAKLDRL